MKNRFLLTALLSGVLFLNSSCDNDTEGTVNKPTITIDNNHLVTDESIQVTILPGEDTEYFRFGIGTAGQETSFTDGTLTGIQTVQGAKTATYTFTGLEASTPYTIYAQSFIGNEKSAVIKMDLLTGDTAYSLTLDKESIVIGLDYIEFKVNTSPKVAYIKYAVNTEGKEDEFEGATLGNIFKENVTEENVFIADGIESGSQYTLYIQAFGAGDQKGKLITYDFKAEVEHPEVDVELYIVRVDYVVFTLSEISRNTASVKYAVNSAGKEEEFSAGTLEGILNEPVEEDDYEEGFRLEVEGLDADTEYTLYVQAVRSDGIAGEVIAIDFKSMLTIPKVTFEVSDITVSSIYVHAIPDDDIQFFLVLNTTKEYFGYYISQGPDRVRRALEEAYMEGAAYLRTSGLDHYLLCGNRVDTDFALIILPYDENNRAYIESLEIFEYMTPSLTEDAPEATIEVEVLESTATTAKVAFKMGPDTLSYYIGVSKNEEGYDYARSWLITLYTVSGYRFQEDMEIDFDELEPGTEYVAWAYPTNVNGVDEIHSYVDTFFTTPSE